MIFKILILAFLLVSHGFAKTKIVTTTPDLAYLARTIGQDMVEVQSLLEGSEDPHFADATPLFMQLSAKADLFLQVGLGLEEGWAPKVLSRSGNRKIQIEGEGLCTVGPAVDILDKPQGKVDRSMGDVHGEGNPHFHLSPKAYYQATKKVHECLVRVAPESSEIFNRGLKKLEAEIEKAQKEVPLILARKSNVKVAEFHKQFFYFFHEFHLPKLNPLEETPGVPPSAGRILARAKEAQAEKLNLMLATNYQNQNILKKFNEISGIPFKIVPAGLIDREEEEAYYQLMIKIAKAIVDAN